MWRVVLKNVGDWFHQRKCCRKKFNVCKFVGLDCKAKCVKIWIWYSLRTWKAYQHKHFKLDLFCVSGSYVKAWFLNVQGVYSYCGRHMQRDGSSVTSWIEFISIWAKRLTRQLIAFVEKHQMVWMFAIIKIILLKIDMAQWNLLFYIRHCCAHRILLSANIDLSRGLWPLF